MKTPSESECVLHLIKLSTPMKVTWQMNRVAPHTTSVTWGFWHYYLPCTLEVSKVSKAEPENLLDFKKMTHLSFIYCIT